MTREQLKAEFQRRAYERRDRDDLFGAMVVELAAQIAEAAFDQVRLNERGSESGREEAASHRETSFPEARR